jgi:nucleoside-diphosphate-sugar epimerase
MHRCLITGASGFVGRNLVRKLAANQWQVQGLVRGPTQSEIVRTDGGEPVLGALDDQDALDAAVAQTDVVFHLAGRTRALAERDFQRDNVGGTRNLARAVAAQDPPPVLVVVSSLAAGGPSEPDGPRCEQQPEQPISAYGRSKLAAEQAATEQCAAIAPVSIVRPPIVFGPGDAAGLAMYRGMKFLPIHPTPGLRNFPVSLIYVEDLCEALAQVALRGERIQYGSSVDEAHYGQGIYYVTAERDVTYGEMGRLAAAAAGWAVAAVPLPKAIFWMAAAVGEITGRVSGKPAVVNFDKAREASASGWVASGAKIRLQLGFATAASLEERFTATVAWYRQQGWI